MGDVDTTKIEYNHPAILRKRSTMAQRQKNLSKRHDDPPPKERAEIRQRRAEMDAMRKSAGIASYLEKSKQIKISDSLVP